MVDIPTVRPVLSLAGEKFLIVTQDETSVPLPLAAFTGSATSVSAHLSARGIHLIGAEMMGGFLDTVARQRAFEPAQLADRGGWNGACFVLPDGSAISPSGSVPPMVGIDAVAGKCSEAGTLKGWKRDVVKPLADQPILEFALMLPFMPPLLRLTSRADNFGFELVGKKGVGKSTAQYLAASVIGSPIRGDSPPYWSTWDMTLNALEEVMPLHSDMLLINDEAALFFADESKAKRASLFKAFAFKAAAGTIKKRLGTKVVEPGFRLSYLSSSNVSLTELLGTGSEVSSAARDRLITINVPPDRPHGAFDFVPDGYGNGSQFAGALMRAAIDNHGVAFRKFLRGLVDARAADEDELKSTIRRYVERFRYEADVDLNDGSAVRVADAFGLVYAAGKLAVAYGVLPRPFNCGPAALACYHLYAAGDRQLSFAERLEQIASDPGTAQINDGEQGLSGKQLKRTSAVLLRKRGKRCLAVLPDHLKRLLPDWTLLKGRSDVLQVLRAEKGRLQTKVRLGRKKEPQRAYVFDLMPDE